MSASCAASTRSKMGADIGRHLSNANTINWPYGQITFTSDIAGDGGAAYMLGFPRETLTPEGQPVSAVRQWRNFFYFQDDWKVSPRLTLNLGRALRHADPAP